MNSIPTVTKNLLIINVLCFFGGVVAMKYGINLNDLLGLHFFMASDFNPAQLITYMFMHGGFQHIFFNMFALWMFGRTLEQVWGPKRFLSYYMVCGIGAGLVQELVQYIQYVTELSPVSYTHLDVYKRQKIYFTAGSTRRGRQTFSNGFRLFQSGGVKLRVKQTIKLLRLYL